MEITRDEIKAVRVAMSAALASVAKQFNLEITPGAASFNPHAFTIKIECVRAGQRVAMASMKHDVLLTSRYGLKVGDLVTASSGHEYKIEGATRSDKFPLEVTRVSDGKRFRLSARGLTCRDFVVRDAWATSNVATR